MSTHLRLGLAGLAVASAGGFSAPSSAPSVGAAVSPSAGGASGSPAASGFTSSSSAAAPFFLRLRARGVLGSRLARGSRGVLAVARLRDRLPVGVCSASSAGAARSPPALSGASGPWVAAGRGGAGGQSSAGPREEPWENCRSDGSERRPVQRDITGGSPVRGSAPGGRSTEPAPDCDCTTAEKHRTVRMTGMRWQSEHWSQDAVRLVTYTYHLSISGKGAASET